MLATRLLKCRCAQYCLRRGYLSEQFKATLSNSQLSNQTSTTIDSFYDITDMQKSGNWHLVPPLTSHLVIKNYMEAGKQSDLLPILKNKLENRIFLDDFTGSYLLDHFIKTNDHSSSVELVVAFQEEFKNDLVVALALKAIYSYLKDPNVLNALVEKKPESKAKPDKKERVGFLRNSTLIIEDLLKRERIGNTILNLTYNKNTHIPLNLRLLGLYLTEQYDDLQTLLKQMPDGVHKDIVEICSKITKDTITDMNGAIPQWNTASTFDEIIDAFITKVAAENESKLIDAQKTNYTKWFDQSKRNEENVKLSTPLKPTVDAENIVKDLEAERKLLWFFDNKDKIELKIFQQKKVYPKKWFGKKKKPKTIDDKYVPPEVIKRVP